MEQQTSLRKRILISLAILIGVAGLVFGGLYAYRALQPEPAVVDTATKKTTPDLSKDYGACTILNKETVKSALGTAGENLQDPQNNGIVGGKKVGDGMDNLVFDAQGCVYAFVSGGTFENGFHSDNGLNVAVTQYTNESGPATFIEAIRGEPLIEEIPDLGDDAFYSSNTTANGPTPQYSFKLQVFKDKTLYEYTIHQPGKEATFTADTAKTALVTIAKSVKTK